MPEAHRAARAHVDRPGLHSAHAFELRLAQVIAAVARPAREQDDVVVAHGIGDAIGNGLRLIKGTAHLHHATGGLQNALEHECVAVVDLIAPERPAGIDELAARGDDGGAHTLEDRDLRDARGGHQGDVAGADALSLFDDGRAAGNLLADAAHVGAGLDAGNLKGDGAPDLIDRAVFVGDDGVEGLG